MPDSGMGSLSIDAILSTLHRVIPTRRLPASLHEPCFNGNELKYVAECIQSGWISSVGPFIGQFEEHLASLIEIKNVVAVVNGTAGLHLGLRAIGLTAHEEVLLPALTFVATANAVAYSQAIPHFVDSDELTLGVDPQKLRGYLKETVTVKDGICLNRQTGRKIRALIAVHAMGHPAALDALDELCKEYKIDLIEDATESLGTKYKGRHTGRWGRFSVLSFNGNKIVTTGGGGAILTNEDVLAKRLRHLSTTAKQPHPWMFYHDEVGYNYRLPNLNAALGVAQLEQLDDFVQRKRELARSYQQAFAAVPKIKFIEEPPQAYSNYWLNALLLDPGQESFRDKVLEATHSAGFKTRPVWNLLHTLPMYTHCPRMDLSQSESIARRLINLPSSTFLLNHD